MLDLETSLTSPRSPLAAAMMSWIPLTRSGASTFIINHREDNSRLVGLAQMRRRPGRPEHVVVFIAPALTGGNGAHAIWQRLLTYLCVKAGEQGGQRLYAGLPADGEEYQIFRHVGFSAYAREDVYELKRPAIKLEDVEPLPVRRQRSSDSWGLQQLYATVTPRPVQNAEGSAQSQWEAGRRGGWGPYANRRGYVWENRDEIWAALQIRSSRGGHWLRMLLHPDALEKAEALIGAALSRVRCTPGQKVYCAVRTYEAGIPTALAAWGFELIQSQTLTVKHTTVWAREPAPQAVHALEGHAESAAPSAVPRSEALTAKTEPKQRNGHHRHGNLAALL
ncbi:MAG: hypothetical protein Kow0063_39430 [Anaerolineae bacterium]